VSVIKPYWQSADGALAVYHAPCETVIASGVLPVREVALVHADGPYGIDYQPVRGCARGLGSGPRHVLPKVEGDDEPFDPSHLLELDRPTVLWGANHFAPRVPGSPSWILWDKREDTGSDTQADGELAWTNLGGPLRIFRHLWRGALRASERGARTIGTTQKPEALSVYVFQRANLKRGDLVFVPYLGSGPDLAVAQAMGLRVIACEVKRKIIDEALSARLGAITQERAAEPCGPLFGAPVKP